MKKSKESMTKSQFEELFQSLVTATLLNNGFKQKGKSLYFEKNEIQIALIRIGGKYNFIEGSIYQVATFRHKFLRDSVSEKLFTTQPKLPEKYLYILPPNKITTENNFNFNPHNHMHLPFERYEFSNKSEDQVCKYLENLSSSILKALSLFQKKSHQEVITDLQKHERTFGLARFWLEDYLANNP